MAITTNMNIASSQFDLKEMVITPQMKMAAKELVELQRYDYKEAKQKHGRISFEFEWEEHQAMKCEVLGNGRRRFTPDPNGDITYELYLLIKVPLKYSFDCTDVHRYLWDNKHGEFEFIETEII